MERRRLLETIAAGGLVGGAVWGIAANAKTTPNGTSPETRPRQVPVESLDALYVLRDGEVRRTLENPTDEGFRRLQESLGPGERISSNEVGTECMTYCKMDCPVTCPDSECHWSYDCSDTKYCCEDYCCDGTTSDTTSN